MHEIAVRAVQFQHIKTCLMRPPRAVGPGLDKVLHLMALQRLRDRPSLAVGKRAWRNRRPGVPVLDLGRSLQRPVAFPWTPRARLAPGVAELKARHRILLFDEPHEPAQRLDEGVIPDAKIAHRAAAAALDLGGFDDDEAGTAGCELAGVHQMPVGRKSLHRGILMHRRHHDAVAKRDVPKLQGREQQGPDMAVSSAVTSAVS